MATPEGSADESTLQNDRLVDTPKADSVAAPPSELDAGRRRFTWAALIATALTAVPFVWILWSLWGSANPLRLSVYEDNFYDLQARAMFHGHLSLPNGSIGIEGFVHGGQQYTYFGLFPSIIRMPILLVTEQPRRQADRRRPCFWRGS